MAKPRDLSGLSGQCLRRDSKLVAAKLGSSSDFLKGKIQVQNRKISLLSNPFSRLKIGPRTFEKRSLVAMMDNECVRQFPRKLSRKSRRDMPLQAYSFDVRSQSELDALVEQSSADPCVLGLTENPKVKALTVTNDTYSSQLYHLEAIRAPQAWTQILNGSPPPNPVTVAVVDTGTNYNHPDLHDNMWSDGTGLKGMDFVNEDTDPIDDNGHGTHVSGLVGARMNNSLGVSGVGGNIVRILPVKVLNNEGEGNLSDVANGIIYATNKGAKVIVLSLGAPTLNAAIQSAVTYAVDQGAVVLTAAGNDGRAITAVAPMAPASYAKDIQGLISVGATVAETGALASFSNFSTTYVEIAAPGMSNQLPSNGLLSTYLSDYGYSAGTSMATPIAAGAAVLAIAKYQQEGIASTPAMIEQILFASALTKSSLSTKIAGGGRSLDLFNLSNLIDDANILLITQNPQSRQLLVGEALALDITTTQPTAVTIQWQKDGVDIPGATGSAFRISHVTTGDAGQYRARISRGSENLLSQNASVTIFADLCP